MSMISSKLPLVSALSVQSSTSVLLHPHIISSTTSATPTLLAAPHIVMQAVQRFNSVGPAPDLAHRGRTVDCAKLTQKELRVYQIISAAVNGPTSREPLTHRLIKFFDTECIPASVCLFNIMLVGLYVVHGLLFRVFRQGGWVPDEKMKQIVQLRLGTFTACPMHDPAILTFASVAQFHRPLLALCFLHVHLTGAAGRRPPMSPFPRF